MIQVFESWAHQMIPQQFETFAKPYADLAMSTLKKRFPDVPVIYFANGGSSYLESQRDTQARIRGIAVLLLMKCDAVPFILPRETVVCVCRSFHRGAVGRSAPHVAPMLTGEGLCVNYRRGNGVVVDPAVLTQRHRTNEWHGSRFLQRCGTLRDVMLPLSGATSVHLPSPPPCEHEGRHEPPNPPPF